MCTANERIDLKEVESAFQTLTIESHDRNVPAHVLSTLATASRALPDTRQRLADFHILSRLTEMVECSMQDDLALTDQALRCIGNACIDNDQARNCIVGLGFSWAVRCLDQGDHDVRKLCVEVLWNICLDHESAQRACYQAHVHHSLIVVGRHLPQTPAPPKASEESIQMISDLLLYITNHRPRENVSESDQLPDELLRWLLELPGHHWNGDEECATLLQVCLTYLRDSMTQQRILERHMVICVWRMFVDVDEKVPILGHVFESTDEDGLLLEQGAASLVWCLSDLAANSLFATSYGLKGDVPEGLISLIAQAGNQEAPTHGFEYEYRSDRGLAAACQMVGNYLFNLPVEQTRVVIEQFKLQTPLWQILIQQNFQYPDLLHSAAGLLVMLCRPSTETRCIVGNDQFALAGMARLCGSDILPLKQSALKLLRALGQDCPRNQERFGEVTKELMMALATARRDAALEEAST